VRLTGEDKEKHLDILPLPDVAVNKDIVSAIPKKGQVIRDYMEAYRYFDDNISVVCDSFQIQILRK
jgi:hypothetical protein